MLLIKCKSKHLPLSSVLLVDGDQRCLTIISDMLTHCGYNVLTAVRASDAFGIIREKEDELDLILAEDRLPDMGRYQLLETVRDTSRLPIVLMSDNKDESAMMGGLYRGALHYLVKPVNMSDLRNLWQLAFVWKQNNVLVARGFGWKPQVQQGHYDTIRKHPPEIWSRHEEKDDDSSGILKRPKLTAFEALEDGSQTRDFFGDLSLATGSLLSLAQKPYFPLGQGHLIPEPTFPCLAVPNDPSSSFNFQREPGLFPDWPSTMGVETQGLVDDGTKQYLSIPYFGSSYFPGDDSTPVEIPLIEPFPYFGNPESYERVNEGLNLTLGGHGSGTSVQPKAQWQLFVLRKQLQVPTPMSEKE